MSEFVVKNLVAIVLAMVSFVSVYAVSNYRLTSLETMQNRQGDMIASIQVQQTEMAASFARLDEKLNALNDNMIYIRSKIDAALK